MYVYLSLLPVLPVMNILLPVSFFKTGSRKMTENKGFQRCVTGVTGVTGVF